MVHQHAQKCTMSINTPKKANYAYEAHAIDLEGHDAALEVSSNHMVYVGKLYEDRHAVRAATVVVGDHLVAL